MSPELHNETPIEQHISQEFAKLNGESEVVTTNPDTSNLFDADAVNTLKFDGIYDDFEITAEWQPETDSIFIEYDKRAATKYTDGGQSADLSGRSDANVYLFDELCSKVEGFPGELPDDWKRQLDNEQVKIPIAQYFTTVAVYTEPFKWGQTEQAIITERYFNGKEVQCRHFPRKKTVDDVKEFRKLQKIPAGTKSKGLGGGDIILPGYAEKKGRLYDQMKTKDPEGYAGRTPLRDKCEVIDFIFSAGLKGKK